MRFVVFPAGPSDAEALAQVHVGSWRETYRDLLPDAYLNGMSVGRHAARFRKGLMAEEPWELVLAAGGRTGLVGYASVGPSRHRVEGEAEIFTLYVLKSAQGAGLGRALTQAAARTMAARGATNLMISVLRDNDRARGFYEHLGGVAETPRPEFGPGGRILHEVTYRWPDIAALAA